MERLNIPRIKQKTSMGCFVTCYLMIRKLYDKKTKHEKNKEVELLAESLSYNREFYPSYFLDKLAKDGFKIRVIVETPYMRWLLRKRKGNVNVKLAGISIEDYERLIREKRAIITPIDQWYLNMFSHYPHYVVVNGFDKSNIFLTDPWLGEEIKIPKDKFMSAINSLKEHILWSPMIIAVGR